MIKAEQEQRRNHTLDLLEKAAKAVQDDRKLHALGHIQAAKGNIHMLRLSEDT